MKTGIFCVKWIWIVAGLVCGILIWEGFKFSLEATANNEFCTSCHTMQAYLYPEYQKSPHYRNREGIQAECSDCHIPKPLVAKLIRKTIGLKDIYHELVGSIDSPEKYAAKKALLSERVLERMRARDSQECRNCHRMQQMELDKQSSVARKRHQEALGQQKTCVDCHRGVGHRSPAASIDLEGSEESFSLE
ncbi:MAG: NapC/NirT family cytochrome c [Gammaproteobacteria bacterium]